MKKNLNPMPSKRATPWENLWLKWYLPGLAEDKQFWFDAFLPFLTIGIVFFASIEIQHVTLWWAPRLLRAVSILLAIALALRPFRRRRNRLENEFGGLLETARVAASNGNEQAIRLLPKAEELAKKLSRRI